MLKPTSRAQWVPPRAWPLAFSFFLHPHGPSLSSRAGIRLQFLLWAPLLPPHLHPHPGGGHLLIPEAKTWGSWPSGWGSLPHNWDSLAYCKPKDMAAQLLSSHITSFLPFGKRCTSFLPFGNLIERKRPPKYDIQKTEIPPIFFKHYFLVAQTCFFLGLTKQGSRIIKCWEPKVSRSGSTMAGGQRCCKQHPLPYWIHSWGERQEQLKTAVGALEGSATDYWWWLQGLHRDLGFLPAPFMFF